QVRKVVTRQREVRVPVYGLAELRYRVRDSAFLHQQPAHVVADLGVERVQQGGGLVVLQCLAPPPHRLQGLGVIVLRGLAARGETYGRLRQRERLVVPTGSPGEVRQD